MTKFFVSSLIQGTAIAALLPSAALADLSAIDVWESWKSLSESSGQTISVGSQETNNGTLILNNVEMKIEFPEGQAVSTLEFLEFRERNDGTVAVTMAADLPLSMTVDPTDGEALDLAMILRQTGTSIVASGDPGNISFDYLSSEISVTVDKIVVDGQVLDADIRLSMNDVDGKYTLISEGSKSYTSAMTAANLTYNVGFTDPENGGQFAIAGTIQNMVSNSDVKLPDELDMTNPAELFGGEFKVRGGFSAGLSSSSLQLDNEDGSMSVQTSGASSALDFSIGNGSIHYGGDTKDVQYTVRSPQIPFPEVSLGFAEVAFNLLMPIVQSDDPKDFALLFKFAGIEISDMIWGMFDPGAIMPRDPATLVVDVSGQMNWLIDIMDPDIADDFDAETPAELHNLAVNEITLSAAGALVAGTGDFTFDNTDLETYEGLPAPTGSISIDIIGANGLMDRLIQMGFLQQEQAMGARMMLGLFARPSGGEDALTSTVDIKGDGSIFANGQQFK